MSFGVGADMQWFAFYVSLHAYVCNVLFFPSGSFGVYVPVNCKDRYMVEFYSKLGFVELNPGINPDTTYVGRTF